MPGSVFCRYSNYYDLLYQDKDYVAESDYIAGVLERFGILGQRVLEFGSGTGKHGKLLVEHGYQITGIERSPEMVAQAECVPGFVCQQGDICTVQLHSTFDAVLALFHVVSYQTTNDALRALFARSAEHLNPGGLFVFDMWYSPAVYAQGPKVRVKRVASDGIEVVRIAEPDMHPNENRVDVHYTIIAGDFGKGAVETMSETHSMRHFSLPELELLAQFSGFEIVGVEEFLSGAQPGEDTWGVCVIMKRI